MRRKLIISARQSTTDFLLVCVNILLYKIHSKVVKSNCKIIRTYLSCRILSTTRLPSNSWTRKKLPWKIALLSNPRCWSRHSPPTYIWRRSSSSTPAVSRSFTWYVPYFSPLYFPSFASFALTFSRFFALSLSLSTPSAYLSPPFPLRFSICVASFFSLYSFSSVFSLLLSLCLHRSSWTAMRRT